MKNKIILPDWLPLKEILYLSKILKPYGEIRLVGGCVRQILSGLKSHDIDLATPIKPKSLIKILKSHQVTAIPTGLKHGTITALYNHHKFEITTLRQDIKTDGRHAEVKFTDDWYEDALRRDFTFNAMYIDLEGNLYDYFKGTMDLKNKLVRFIGEPQKRIEEDYLRILRYFRFFAYMGGTNIDEKSLHACKENLSGLKNLSGERINDEMRKILSSSFAKESLLLMNEINLFPAISLKNLNYKFNNFSLSEDPTVNLAAIIINSRIELEEFKQLSGRWKFSNSQKKLLLELCFKEGSNFFGGTDFEHMAYIYYHGNDLYKLKYSLHKVMQPKLNSPNMSDWEPPLFPIDGNTLLKKGLDGPNLGKTLKKLETKWVESDFKLTKQELLKLL